ncbi:hypothetical protein Holit_02014 [Hollandina sp. SP2]
MRWPSFTSIMVSFEGYHALWITSPFLCFIYAGLPIALFLFHSLCSLYYNKEQEQLSAVEYPTPLRGLGANQRFAYDRQPPLVLRRLVVSQSLVRGSGSLLPSLSATTCSANKFAANLFARLYGPVGPEYPNFPVIQTIASLVRHELCTCSPMNRWFPGCEIAVFLAELGELLIRWKLKFLNNFNTISKA